jgi:hypothetical protein
LRIFLLEL